MLAKNVKNSKFCKDKKGPELTKPRKSKACGDNFFGLR